MSALGRPETVDASPFDLGPREARAATLCLHGLTGTPYEIRPVAEALARAGIRARGPSLPGHGSTPDALAGLPHTAWLDDARCELSALREAHERVFLAGLSMGGLLALALAAEEPVHGLAVIGTPLRLPFPVPLLIGLMKRVRRYQAKTGGSDIRDAHARARHPSYDVMPLASVHELVQLQRRVVADLGRIRTPILIAHGAHDATAKPANAYAIAQRVGSRDTQVLILENSAHVVPVDHDGERLAQAVVSFFLGLA